VYSGDVARGDDDPELVALRALNDRIEALCARRFDANGGFDAEVEGQIDLLDRQAAALIRARTDRTLAPIVRRTDAALVVAHRLLGMPPPEGVSIGHEEALAYLRSLEPLPIGLAGCPAVGVGGFHSDGYADPDDGLCQLCGLRSDTTPPRSTPPGRS
jgi:hypothetical protein